LLLLYLARLANALAAVAALAWAVRLMPLGDLEERDGRLGDDIYVCDAANSWMVRPCRQPLQSWRTPHALLIKSIKD
jgi:hypothetical protein